MTAKDRIKIVVGTHKIGDIVNGKQIESFGQQWVVQEKSFGNWGKSGTRYDESCESCWSVGEVDNNTGLCASCGGGNNSKPVVYCYAYLGEIKVAQPVPSPVLQSPSPSDYASLPTYTYTKRDYVMGVAKTYFGDNAVTWHEGRETTHVPHEDDVVAYGQPIGRLMMEGMSPRIIRYVYRKN